MVITGVIQAAVPVLPLYRTCRKDGGCVNECALAISTVNPLGPRISHPGGIFLLLAIRVTGGQLLAYISSSNHSSCTWCVHFATNVS